jgi:hypothetical protein
MRAQADSDYSRFLDSFLPEFESKLSNLEETEKQLDRLRNYYAGLSAAEQVPRLAAGRVAVITIDPWRNWAAEIKAAVLVTDLIICDDPLLYAQDEIKSSSYFKRYGIGGEAGKQLLVDLARQAGWLRQVLPLVRAGLLVFRPLRMTDEKMVAAVKRAVTNHLKKHLELTPYFSQGSRHYMEYQTPLLGKPESKVEIDTNYWEDSGMSTQDIAQFELKPGLIINSLTTLNGLSLADKAGGSFWSGSDLHWRLARDAVHALSPATKLISFVETFTRPVIERTPAKDLLAIRANEEAFYTFRDKLAFTQGLISSFPDQEQFASESKLVFEEVFRPNIRLIEAAMRKNVLLRDLPYAVASAGFSMAAAMTAGPIRPESLLFGALASTPGFVPIFRELRDPEARVRSAPAFVFWKLGVPGQPPTDSESG